MHYSEVHVSYRDGSKPKGTRVVIGFGGAMSAPAYTDAHGTALVEHSSTGRATVYVSGKNLGSFHAPGKTAVFIQ